MWREWEDRCYWASLVEQLQLVQLLDTKVQARFNRALDHKLKHAPDAWGQRTGISLLHSLEAEFANPNAERFQRDLKEFNQFFLAANFHQVASFHAFAGVFELFVAYSLVKSWPSGTALMPQSWIDLHLPQFARFVEMQSLDTVVPDNTRIYEDCLVDLAVTFTNMLLTLNQSHNAGTAQGFWSGTSEYPRRLLHRRNCELLAIVVHNLSSNNRSARIQGLCKKVSEVGSP